jgi:hypothetical protein
LGITVVGDSPGEALHDGAHVWRGTTDGKPERWWRVPARRSGSIVADLVAVTTGSKVADHQRGAHGGRSATRGGFRLALSRGWLGLGWVLDDDDAAAHEETAAALVGVFTGARSRGAEWRGWRCTLRLGKATRSEGGPGGGTLQLSPVRCSTGRRRGEAHDDVQRLSSGVKNRVMVMERSSEANGTLPSP